MRKNNKLFQHRKNVILFLHDYKCYICKYQNISNHVHHIDKNGDNHNAFNLIVLCLTCHQAVHKLNYTLLYFPEKSYFDSLIKLNSFS